MRNLGLVVVTSMLATAAAAEGVAVFGDSLVDAKLYRFSYLDFYARFNAEPASYNFQGPVNYTTPCIAA